MSHTEGSDLDMKGRGFGYRLRFALAGLREAFAGERSFRVQLLAAACALGAILWLRPPLFWAALIVTMIGLVLAAELVNTALEHTLDGLHAEHAEFGQCRPVFAVIDRRGKAAAPICRVI